MNSRRGSTFSPISVRNISSALKASSSCTCSSVRLAGSSVVSQSSSAVHLAQALEAGDRHAALAELADLGDQLAQVRQDAALVAVLQEETRRRLAAGYPRRRHQVRRAQTELAQPLQAAVDAAHLVQLLHR